MTVRVAKRGPNPGGELWGCDKHFITGCRGTRSVPSHHWDWYQLVPIPVRIIENQHRWLSEAAGKDRILNPWIEHYESTDGMFGRYEDYDEHMLVFEEAMEVAESYFDSFAEMMYRMERPRLRAIERVLRGDWVKVSMARRAVLVVERYIGDESSIQLFSAWLTANFDGSQPALVGPERGGIDGGIVSLDDGSQLAFHRRSEGVLVTERRRGMGLSALKHTNLLSQFDHTTARLSMSRFEEVAKYFARNFGLEAPANTQWVV